MVITALDRTQAKQIIGWLEEKGFWYHGSLYYSQEWVNDKDEHVFVHKGFTENNGVEKPLYEWEVLAR